MSQSDSAPRQEWITLQTQYDKYEMHSLFIKLVNVFLLCMMLINDYVSLFAVALLAILWLQDSIWKTFQQRIENRLFVVEKMLAKSEHEGAMQFNTSWLASRPGTVGLVKEYLAQSIRPTVAFPHALLVVIALAAGPLSSIS